MESVQQLMLTIKSFVEKHHIGVSSVQCESKKVAPLKLFAIFSLRLSIFPMKFCQYVASLYLHIITNNFGGFILIFNKMALIFLGVAIVFNVFSFKFHQVKSL